MGMRCEAAHARLVPETIAQADRDACMDCCKCRSVSCGRADLLKELQLFRQVGRLDATSGHPGVVWILCTSHDQISLHARHMLTA